MNKIKELIVVEGKHDKAKLEKLFDCEVVITNGLALSQETIEYIKQASISRGVIVMTDPDNPGEKIRRQIIDANVECEHIFIEKKKAIGKRNVGIEYVKDEDIVEAFKHKVYLGETKNSLSWYDYLDLNLNSKEKREKISEIFNIGHCNNKTLFKRLNVIGVSKKDILEKIND